MRWIFISACGQSIIPIRVDLVWSGSKTPPLGTPWARPVWSASIEPNVVCAGVVDPFARPPDRIDLPALSHFLSLIIDEEDIEHLLLSDGRRSIRSGPPNCALPTPSWQVPAISRSPGLVWRPRRRPPMALAK